ncbi:MAG: hypothetical protein ABI378_16240, partial [Chitinophagaceae bacterium]
MKKALKYFLLSLLILVVTFLIYFFAIKRLDAKVLEERDFTSLPKVNKPFLVPSAFVNNGSFYIKLALKSGDTILAFGDSGGGLCMMPEPSIEQLHLQSKVHTGLVKGVMPMSYILFSDLVGDDNFPQPNPLRSFVIRNPFIRVSAPYFIIPPMNDEVKLIRKIMPEMSVFLGQGFFMNKAWTIDYPQQKIWVNTPLQDGKINNPEVQKIGLKKNANGETIFGHASIKIEIDEEVIDVLFDTGASIILSDEGRKELHTQAKLIAGSFIAASVFNKWRIKHPDWRYFPNAEKGADVIEVPIIKIGTQEVGPVLFAKRRDEMWSVDMIGTMDKVVKGAIGGSALKYLCVTIDY